MTNLDWAIEEIGEKNKYTMIQVMLLQKRSGYDLTKQEAMNLVHCVAEHFSKPIAKTIEYVDLQSEEIEVLGDSLVCNECSTQEGIQEREGHQQNGTDFIQIHHFEKCPNTGLIIFYVNTRCKKKRTKRFTGSLDNYDFQTRSYNNLDRSFSKIYENT